MTRIRSLPQQPRFRAELQPIKLSAPKDPPEKDEDIGVGIPMRAWGLPSSSLGRVRGIKLTLQAPDGFQWDSGWQGYYGLFGPSEHQWRQGFYMKYKTYERLKSVPLKAKVSVAVEVLREHDFETIRATAGELNVPRVGRCRVREKDGETLRCHAPLVKPPMVVVRVDPASSTCPAQQDDWRDQLSGVPYSWEAGRDSDVAEYGVSPVSSFSFYFGRVRICPETVISFSFPEFMENTRSDFEFSIANLDEYRRPGLFDGGAVSWGLYTR